MTLKAPFIPYEKIGEYVKEFLDKYHPSLKLPIPIEGIIEFDLGLHIVPVPNFYKSFGQSGFLSADRTRIFIDEYQYDNFVEKYRFTLAHEIGHFVLHNSLYENFSFSSEQEYLEFYQSMPKKELYWYETQADWFAEQLLVPTKHLEKICIDFLEANNDQSSKTHELPQEFWSYASNELAESFEVNPIVIDIRIRHEGLVEKLQDYYLQK